MVSRRSELSARPLKSHTAKYRAWIPGLDRPAPRTLPHQHVLPFLLVREREYLPVL